MKFREGQVEYLIKNDMSLLGPMDIRWKESSTGSQSQIFCYYFVEYFIKEWYGTGSCSSGCRCSEN